MLKIFVVALCATICALVKSQDDKVIVKIDQGTVKGLKVVTDGLEYLSFRGIRYAQPPVGPLRFKVRLSLNFIRRKKYFHLGFRGDK